MSDSHYIKPVLMPLSNNDLINAWKAIAIIEKEYYEHYTSIELAQMVGTNKSTLNLAVRKIKGMPVKQYVVLVRVNKAKELLLNPAFTMEYISGQVGVTRKNLGKQFRKLENMTPREWRKKYIDKISTPLNGNGKA
jgi:YesN/AraC family two-component response regulator